MKILFVSGSDPATNPRIVKEMEFAVNQGHEAHLVYFESNNWSKDISNKILKNLPNVITHPINNNWSTFRNKKGHILRKLSRIFGILPGYNILMTRSIAHSERSYYIHKKLTNINVKFDWIIAHTLCAFTPSYRYSLKHSCKLGIDVEDYHPAEVFKPSFLLRNETKNREYVMRKTLPKANYVSFASPGIMDATLELVGQKLQHKEVVNNAFWSKQFNLNLTNSSSDSPLKMVWFSQNISAGRGLEEILNTLKRFKTSELQLTLIGNLNNDFYQNVLKQFEEYIQISAPLDQKDLFFQLGNYDVGLALETPLNDFNREICLTNKIWAYYQSGIYILATDTQAQIQFINDRDQHGVISKNIEEDLYINIKNLIKEKENIRSNYQNRYANAKEQSFEAEVNKLDQIWN